MTPHDAAKLLALDPAATPEQIETRFLELRAKLEDKIAKAPTPGLKEKYRESLTEITTAFETLTLAADSSTLPVLKKESAGGPARAGHSLGDGSSPRSATPAPDVTSAPANPKPKTQKSGREFALVAVIAVVVLGAGGWWVMKTKAENEEKARVAAEQKAEAERQAVLAKEQAERDRLAKEAAAKAEQERLDRLFTSLRSKMAELNVAYDAQMRVEQAAERELSELKSQERDLARDQKGAPTPELRRLSAQVRAQDRLVDWMRASLAAHPARVAKAKAEELLSARATADAAEAVEAYTAALAQLKADIAGARADLAVTGALKLSSNLAETTWHLTDAFGVERSGVAPATVEDVAFGKGALVFKRAGWPDLRLALDYRKGTDGAVAAEFPIGSLKIESAPAGARIFRGEENLGVTPLEIAPMPPGPVEFRLSLKGHKSKRVSGTITGGRALQLQATLEPGRGTDPEILLERALEEIPLVADPRNRANVALGFITSLHKLGALPRSALAPLLEAHLAACRALTDPKAKRETLAYSVKEIARVDLARSRAWADEMLPLIQRITDKTERQTAYSMADNFFMHPEVATRMLAPMEAWFGAEDWVHLASLARMHRSLGQENEAQRLAARARDNGPYGEYQNKTVNEYLAAGLTRRQLIPVKMALLAGDLATAQRLFGGVQGVIGMGDDNELANEFMALGDFTTPHQLALFKNDFGSSVADLLPFTLAFSSIQAGNLAKGESLAASLTDGADHQWRSMTYRFLAQQYLFRGQLAEARAAARKSTGFATYEHSTDRIDTAELLAQVGLLDEAKRLAATVTVTFTAEQAWKIGRSAAMHAALGDLAAADRALNFVASAKPDYADSATAAVVKALTDQGRSDTAATYLPRIKDSQQVQYARSHIVNARFRRADANAYDELIDSAAPGEERLGLMGGVLYRQVLQAQAERFK